MVVNEKLAARIRSLVADLQVKRKELAAARWALCQAINKKSFQPVRELDEAVCNKLNEVRKLRKKLRRTIERARVSRSLAQIAGTREVLAETAPAQKHLFSPERKDSHGY